MVLDKYLKFSPYVSSDDRFMRYVISSTRQKKSDPDKNQNSHIFVYVRSVLTYACLAWGPGISKSNLKRTEAIQIIGLRTILTAPNYVTDITLRTTAGLHISFSKTQKLCSIKMLTPIIIIFKT